LSVKVPVAVPNDCGLNVTLIAQLAPAATEAPQVSVSAKLPLTEMPDMARGRVPVLVNVTACALLVVPSV